MVCVGIDEDVTDENFTGLGVAKNVRRQEDGGSSCPAEVLQKSIGMFKSFQGRLYRQGT